MIEEYNFMELEVSGDLVMTLQEMLQFSVLIIGHHLIVIINLVLGEESNQSINEITGSAEKTLVLTLVKQRQILLYFTLQW